uniref:EOG090X0EEI n=1 Tax=Lynceus sp. MCZ IZ 141354 TaxID=1930659 RepID=A0A9N6WRM2_9CRUS|nr:EOG090X0EEI [Lynceus sp. MCZ IZ 141354]
MIRRPPRSTRSEFYSPTINLQGLIRFALTGTAGEDPTRPTQFTPMDEERRVWLQEALTSMSVNVIEELSKALEVLNPERLANPEEEEDDFVEALECIIDFVDSIDTAKDFIKIGGLSIIKPSLDCPHSGVRAAAGELLATVVQNNPFAQEACVSVNILPILLDRIENDSIETVRVKTLYALSCLCRDFPAAQEQLSSCDGFSCLMRTLQSNCSKLKIKTSFMIASLCQQNPALKDCLCDMGFVEQLIWLVHSEHDATHEHLLSALFALISEHPRAIQECRRPELMLETFLQQRIKQLADNDEDLEEVEHCKAIQNICFPNDTNDEIPR